MMKFQAVQLKQLTKTMSKKSDFAKLSTKSSLELMAMELDLLKTTIYHIFLGAFHGHLTWSCGTTRRYLLLKRLWRYSLRFVYFSPQDVSCYGEKNVGQLSRIFEEQNKYLTLNSLYFIRNFNLRKVNLKFVSLTDDQKFYRIEHYNDKKILPNWALQSQ